MLLKRDTPISGVFDVETIEATDSSGVPTPRVVAWSNDHLTTTEPLPVVTAKKEPTERGLGIPPPPPGAEISWHSRMPSIASLSPLSMDNFEAGVPTPRVPRPADVEPSENERITVPAPPLVETSPRKRRRVLSASILVAATVLVLLVARRGTEGPESASAAAARPVVHEPAAIAPSEHAPLAVETNPTPRAPAVSANTDVHEAVPATKPVVEAHLDAHRRARKARTPERTNVVAGTDTSVVDPWHGSESAEPPRRAFSRPPR